jgi:predicted NACHT family NTPase
VLLLDGLDEAPNRVRREAMARLFENTTRKYAKCGCVVTTRPQSYMGGSTLGGFHHVRIDELETEAIEGFLAHWSRCLYPEDPAGARKHLDQLLEALRADRNPAHGTQSGNADRPGRGALERAAAA